MHLTSLKIGLIVLALLSGSTVYFDDENQIETGQFYRGDFMCSNCNNFVYDYVIENAGACGEADVFLLYAVVSAPEDQAERDAVRDTWGSVTHSAGRGVRTLFFIGYHDNQSDVNAMIMAEQRVHGDIIQGKFADSYKTLTNKVQFALRWVTAHCPQAEYIVKTDEDMFNVPSNYIRYLTQINTGRRFVGGQCLTFKPKRGVSEKNYVPYSLYNYIYTPFYCKGGGYILSQQAARDIISVASSVKWYPNEDVFHTGMCRLLSGLRYTQVPGVVRLPEEVDHCALRHNILSVHTFGDTQKVKELWRMLDTTGNDSCSTFSWTNLYILICFMFTWISIFAYICTRPFVAEHPVTEHMMV